MEKTDIEVLEPYKQEGNLYFFRDGKSEMVIQKVADNHYRRISGLIDWKEIRIFTTETITNPIIES